jgi:hypothetical protein
MIGSKAGFFHRAERGRFGGAVLDEQIAVQ